MTVSALNSYEDLIAHTLDAINEPTDGTSGWDGPVREIVVKQHRRLIGFFGWICLEKYPPATVLVPTSISDLTVTVTAGGTAVTLGGPVANYAATKLGWKFQPSGKDYYLRITAHTATSSAATIAGAPEALTASAGVLYQDELDLPSDCNFLLNAAWARGGVPVPIKSDETARDEYREPVSAGWPPTSAVRLGKARIRVTSYPNDGIKLLEIPYTYDPGDPSGSSAMSIEAYLRTLLAQMALGPSLRLKHSYAQALTEEQLAIRQMDEAKDAEEKKRKPIAGNLSSAQKRPAYS